MAVDAETLKPSDAIAHRQAGGAHGEVDLGAMLLAADDPHRSGGPERRGAEADPPPAEVVVVLVRQPVEIGRAHV